MASFDLIAALADDYTPSPVSTTTPGSGTKSFSSTPEDLSDFSVFFQHLLVSTV